MKTLLILTACMLSFLVGTVQAADDKTPLKIKIAMEQQLLAEDYQAALKKCREHKHKGARNACIVRKKELFSQSFQNLQQDPQAYFIAKEQSYSLEKNS